MTHNLHSYARQNSLTGSNRIRCIHFKFLFVYFEMFTKRSESKGDLNTNKNTILIFLHVFRNNRDYNSKENPFNSFKYFVLNQI